MLTETKGEEYKRSDDNQFANFERGAKDFGVTREVVLSIYLSKHYDAIKTYIKDGMAGTRRHYSEPITGRIDDAILYLLLLRGMLDQRPMELVEPAQAEKPKGIDPRPDYVICCDYIRAIEYCRKVGLPASMRALCAVDQLLGIKGAHVLMIDYGDERSLTLRQELQEHCLASGNTWSIKDLSL